MILAVDVHYQAEKATAAGVLFEQWDTRQPERRITAEVSEFEGYQPGEFYRRELPPILGLLDEVDPLPSHIVVDGYVTLGEGKKPGLGKYLYDALGEKCIVIGVAKSRYRGTPEEAELYRGESVRPLYITAAGISQREAKGWVRAMYGKDRNPYLLQMVDRLSRGLHSP